MAESHSLYSSAVFDLVKQGPRGPIKVVYYS